MKNLCIACVLSVFLFSLVAPVQAADLKDGFLEYKWGTNVIDYPELKFLYSKGEIGYYGNPGKSYTIKEITVNNVVFGFYQQKLFAV